MKINCKYDELLPVAEIVPNPENQNTHTKADIVSMAKVLEYWGWDEAPIVNSEKMLITGHKRYAAALHNKWTHIPVQYRQYDSHGLELAKMISDNAVGQASEMDKSIVNSQLGDIGPLDDLGVLGLADFVVDMSELGSQTKDGIKCETCGQKLRKQRAA